MAAEETDRRMAVLLVRWCDSIKPASRMTYTWQNGNGGVVCGRMATLCCAVARFQKGSLQDELYLAEWQCFV